MRDDPLGFDQGADRQLVPTIGSRADNARGAGLMKQVDGARAERATGFRLSLRLLQRLDDFLHIGGGVHRFLPQLLMGP